MTSIDRSQALIREQCIAVVGATSHSLKPEQAFNAALIAGIAVHRNLPPRAASIAIATAIQESGLRNLDYGDTAGPDSRGLFQQRPSQGWGTQEQVMDPVFATNSFYDRLVKVTGYADMPITEAAQKVQISAFPQAYADHAEEARAFASALTGFSPAALDCILRQPVAAGDPIAVQAAAAAVFGDQQSQVNGRQLQLQAAGETGWAKAHWAVASAKALNIESVSYSGLQWQRSGGWTGAETDTGVVSIQAADGPKT